MVIDVNRSWVVASGLDGELCEQRTRRIDTVDNYKDLIGTLVKHARTLMPRQDVKTLGIGVTVPGLIDHRRGLDILSPNVHVIDGRSPGSDLAERLGVECVMIQDQHALCMAERHFGKARGLDDFAILDVSSGVGMGVMSGGRLVRGHSGFAGEIGHITVTPGGHRCGCGNRGCLETVASDTALAKRVSRRIGREVDIDEVIRLTRAGELDPQEECKQAVHYLAIGLATVINIFNPATLFIHGQLFDVDESLFARVLDQTRKRTLPPSFADCRIIRARGSKRQGAVAGIIQHLIDSVVPELHFVRLRVRHRTVCARDARVCEMPLHDPGTAILPASHGCDPARTEPRPPEITQGRLGVTTVSVGRRIYSFQGSRIERDGTCRSERGGCWPSRLAFSSINNCRN